MIRSAVFCSVLLACSSSLAVETSITAREVHIQDFAGPEEKRLACNRGVEVRHCNLRIYQVMVEAFIDGDPAIGYGLGYGTSHHKGDLQGIINSLDYIRSLGVNTLWLTPVFDSRPMKRQGEWSSRLDATGYYATDFFHIDTNFGSDALFQKLVDEVHQRDMYLLLDGSFGHYKENVVTSPSGVRPINRLKCVAVTPELDWYPDGSTRQACADYDHTETRDYFNEVIGYWIQNFKVDGWRLDQAYQVPLNQWRDYRVTAERVANNTRYINGRGRPTHPLGYLVAEILWHEGGPWYNSKAYGTNEAPALASAFNFHLRRHLVSTLATDESSENINRPATWLAEGFALQNSFPDHAMPNLMLGNHDLVRFGDLIQRAGFPGPNSETYWERHRTALTFLAAFSGPITLYYGEELGQEVPGYAARVVESCAQQGLCDDHVARTSGKVENLTEQQTALKDHVTRLMQLRIRYPALAIGSRTHVYSDDAVYVDLKKAGSSQVLLAMNTKNEARTVYIRRSLLGDARAMRDLLREGTITASGDEFAIELPPLSARLLAL